MTFVYYSIYVERCNRTGGVAMKKKVLLAIAALLLLVFVYQGSLAFFRLEKGVSTPISAKQK